MRRRLQAVQRPDSDDLGASGHREGVREESQGVVEKVERLLAKGLRVRHHEEHVDVAAQRGRSHGRDPLDHAQCPQ